MEGTVTNLFGIVQDSKQVRTAREIQPHQVTDEMGGFGGFVGFLGAPMVARPQNTVPTETVIVQNLRQPAEILIDHWGVPHIYAKNEADLFFAQGFNAARDRLFQIDLWRRRGLGELSEAFGPAYVEQDKSPEELIEDGMDAELVRKVVALVDRAEYKRRQAPPGVKITPKAFGRDRRLPITNAYRRK